VVVREVRLSGTRTLATRLGHWPEMAAVALVLLALAGAAPMRRRRARDAAQERIAEER
jgi:apolipoprotein N-acyltransferase